VKVNIVGGGPAGLYLAILMKKRDASHEISVFERTPADVTWGWGVVFSDKTLAYLMGSDELAHQRLRKKLNTWNDVVVLYQGGETRVRGNPFSAVGRIEILRILQERCTELGVHMEFETNIDDPASLRDCDLLVGADGVNSIVRSTWSDAFEPDVVATPNKFIWLGTRHLFTGLTLAFAETDDGPFAAHAYKFNDDTSTFIAECTEETWRNAGLDQADEAQTLAYVAKAFAHELEGKPVMSNASRWINFQRVKNKRWHHENIILLGDALHTAHFSIGSGTKLALEDSIVLSDCLHDNDGVASALSAFETARRPAVEKLQAAAQLSRVWFEEFGDKLGPDPALFTFDCMTRSGRVDMDLLRSQDPEFVAAYEAARDGQ